MIEIPSESKMELLQQIFRAVANVNDWKAPISAYISPSLREITAEAIEFFTATTPEFTPNGETLHVYSIGYRHGPAGDH